MFVISVHSGQEEKTASLLCKIGVTAFAPTKTMMVRKLGKWRTKTETLFKGYIFVDVNNVSDKNYYKIIKTVGVIGILDYKNPLPEHEKDYITKLKHKSFDNICHGKIIDGKLIITSGSLMYTPHRIIKYSRRQRWIKVEIMIYNKPIVIKYGLIIESTDSLNAVDALPQ